LGVSCTNVLDEVKAMNFLKRWIMLNPKYKMEGINNIIPDEMSNLPTYKIEDIKNINEQLIKVFDEAVKINPNDPELLVLTMLYSRLWPFSSSLKENTRFPLTYSIEL
jgi:peroxin-5